MHENVARVRMSSLTNTTLKDRMQALSVATTGVMPPVLKEAIDNWYKSEPFPEWVLFIMLIRLNSYYQFYDREGMVLWNAVVRKFKYELRVANALAFADIPLMAATNRIDNIDTAEHYAEAIKAAKAEVPPKIQELLLLLNIRIADGIPGLYENPFRERYLKLRGDALRTLGTWLNGKVNGDYRDALPNILRADEDEELTPSQPPTVPASPVQDDSDAGGVDAIQQAVDDALSRMPGLSDAQQIELLRRLARQHGCKAAALLCMSDRGRRLGVCENEALWEQLSRDQGWTNPPVSRLMEGEPRQVLVRKEKFALVLYKKRAWTEHRDAEYVTLPGESVPVYNWHSYFMQRCGDKR